MKQASVEIVSPQTGGLKNLTLDAAENMPASLRLVFFGAMPVGLSLLTVNPVTPTEGVLTFTPITSTVTAVSVTSNSTNVLTFTQSGTTGSVSIAANLVSPQNNLNFLGSDASGVPSWQPINLAHLSGLIGQGAGKIAAGDDSRLHLQNTDSGTSQTSFQIGIGQPQSVILNQTAGTLSLGVSGTTDLATLRVKELQIDGPTVTRIANELVQVTDNIIELNSNFTTGTPTENFGITGKRGNQPDAGIFWSEGPKRFEAGIVGALRVVCRRAGVQVASSDLNAQGLVTVVHNLNHEWPVCVVYDNNREVVIPNGVKSLDANSSQVNLRSFMGFPGLFSIEFQG